MSEAPYKTPLFDAAVSWGARMVDFAGWSMPVQFTGITEEHVHTRTACSLFDVSHMGRLVLTGTDCASFLNRLCTRNLADAEPGRSYYSHMCREDGGILDDLIVSRNESSWGIVCNAANRAKVIAWLDRHRAGADVTIQDVTLSTMMIAIQGPKTLELARELVDVGLASIRRYHHRTFELMGMPVTVFRSGYTGEDGFEVVAPAAIAALFVPRLLGTREAPHAVIRPAGLGARDTLRLEAAMPLYGHELSEAWDSLTAGQGWCVDLTKDFIGADAMRALESRGPNRRVIGLVLSGRRIARQGSVVRDGDRSVGTVTSGTLGPTLGQSIAMAIVDIGVSEVGTNLSVEISGKAVPARVVKLPFYKRSA